MKADVDLNEEPMLRWLHRARSQQGVRVKDGDRVNQAFLTGDLLDANGRL